MKPLVVLLAAALVLAGCGQVRDSRANPFNWFGSSQAGPQLGETTRADGRPQVAQVTALTVEPTSSGALVRAEGLVPTLGWYRPALVAENNGRPVGGVLTYRFVASAPGAAQETGSERARTVTAAATISEITLEQVARIVVAAEGNSRSVNR